MRVFPCKYSHSISLQLSIQRVHDDDDVLVVEATISGTIQVGKQTQYGPQFKDPK